MTIKHNFKNNILTLGLSVSLLIIGGSNSYAQGWAGKIERPKQKINLQYGPLKIAKTNEAEVEKFRNYGLGQFVHWGLYALPGGYWNGVKSNTPAEWIRHWSGNSKPEGWADIYDNLYKGFNPKDFDAKKWAKQAKEMGVRYMIFTTKHHDGFALWPTKYTDYNISNSPFKRDIVKEVVEAYNAEGIDVYLYFSIVDWHHKGYMSNIPTTREQILGYEDFKEYTKNQLFELLANYPTVKGLWFDGSWDKAWMNQYVWTANLEKEIRTKYPKIIIGSRFRNDERGSRHFDSNGDLLGDYEQVWERKLPPNYEMLEGNAWDCIMTLTPGDWGYVKDWDKKYIKSSGDLLDLLVRSRSMGGNLVVNFGPDGDGNMAPFENKISKEIGEWMKINSEAIYDAGHVKLDLSKYGYFTAKGNVVYLTVFNRPYDNILRIPINPKNKFTPKQAELLDNGEKLVIKHSRIGLDRDPNEYYDIQIPKKLKTEKPFVIKLHFENKNVVSNQNSENAHI